MMDNQRALKATALTWAWVYPFVQHAPVTIAVITGGVWSILVVTAGTYTRRNLVDYIYEFRP
ncbi:hypothetical protein SBA3_1560011 [Candidatus Sulfopaludibacter sp. SbA3]|nr:hypothetical protein SBA3_1560011 [Candidatus Sulfopaludibacter sp. SbA3]